MVFPTQLFVHYYSLFVSVMIIACQVESYCDVTVVQDGSGSSGPLMVQSWLHRRGARLRITCA